MPNDRAARAALWLALAFTADANRRYYGLPTTWVPHGVGNTVALTLPELVSALDHLATTLGISGDLADTLRATAVDVTTRAPGWAPFVAPQVLAYVVSHPRFNIYKGDWGDMHFLGFGLDAIPHSATAYALTALVYRGIGALARNTPLRAPFAPLVSLLEKNPVVVSAIALGLLTFLYELGEYRIHHKELEAADGDISRINMMWDPVDTVTDILSNTAGWLAATLLTQREASPSAAPAPAAA